jgi:putative (di)nucleoside polyphosphate hydrolase
MLYRKNVGICLINKENKIFAGKRINSKENEGWQMPQGGVDSLEDEKILLDGMYLELYEEIGLKKEHVEIIKISETVKYNFSEETIKDKNKFKGFIGQEQKWVYLKFLEQDSHINLINDQHPEFCEWKWVEAKFLIDNIIEMKKEVYKVILSNIS